MSKGIKDFIECSRKINNHIKAKFVLVGTPDSQNPDAIPIEQLKKWNPLYKIHRLFILIIS